METVNRILNTVKAFLIKFVAIAKDAPDHTAEYDPKDVSSNTLMAVLSYLSWLVLIPFFLAKDSRYTRFHVNQGIVLAIAHSVIGVGLGLLAKTPLIGWIFAIVNWLCSLVFFVAMVWGIHNAVRGRAKEMPIVSGIQIVK